MSRRTWSQWFRAALGSREPRKPKHKPRVIQIESLNPRLTPAVTAAFSAGVLSVFGDSLDNTITVSRNAAGTLLVNGGAVAIGGGVPPSQTRSRFKSSARVATTILL